MEIFQRCYQSYRDWMGQPPADDSNSAKEKMIILHDEDNFLHETVELLGAKLIPAFESPARLKSIVHAIHNSGRYKLQRVSATHEDQIATLELAKATHNPKYLDHIQNVFQSWIDIGLIKPDESVLPECFRLHNKAVSVLEPPKDTYARAGYYAFDMSTGISKNSWRSIIASANLAVQAAKTLVSTHGITESPSEAPSSPPKSVLALCRPPGHHCTGQQAGGYCYINNLPVSITTLRQFSTEKRSRSVSNPHFSAESDLKFAILDLDFHHGNGTQEIFYDDSNVLYVSLHGQDEFPYYTGSASERGPENTPAYDLNVNFPLPVGTSFDTYKSTLQQGLDRIKEYDPDYLLLSLGFDTFHLDPLGSFKIRTENYREIAEMVRTQILDVQALIILEGGYVVERLGENLVSFLDGWVKAEKERNGDEQVEDYVDLGSVDQVTAGSKGL